MLPTAPPGQEFVFHDQSKATNLQELLERIRGMPSEEFGTFIDASKNDFASWVEHALREEALAERLRQATTKEATLLRIGEKLDEHTAQANLFALAQQQSAPKASAPAADPIDVAKAAVNLPLLERKMLVREFLIGLAAGIVLGILLARIITAWFL